MNEFKITLDHLNEILKVLGELPAKTVFETILKIHKLVADQQTPPTKED